MYTFAELARDIERSTPSLGSGHLTVVDGPAGSGKTTFAANLAAASIDAQVLHMDDLYEGWSGGLTPDVWQRLHDQVLRPLAEGRHGRYQHYDWRLGQLGVWRDVPLRSRIVLEGVGAAERSVDPLASLRVWVEADPALRLARGIARDGAAMTSHWLRWMRLEAAHFAKDETKARADLVVDGASMSAGRPESYVVIEDRRPTRDGS